MVRFTRADKLTVS